MRCFLNSDLTSASIFTTKHALEEHMLTYRSHRTSVRQLDQLATEVEREQDRWAALGDI